MKKEIQITGIGNALVDILVEVNDQEFSRLGLEKASMRLVSIEEQDKFLDQVNNEAFSLASGGSVANSIIAISQLGGKSAFISRIADDRFGRHYTSEFAELGILLPVKPSSDGGTGTSLVLITPDAERTMQTCLGVSSTLGPEHLDESIIARSQWLFLEGYILSNPGSGSLLARHALKRAKEHGTKIAFTFSEAWVVETFRNDVEQIVTEADFLFANEKEACAYTDKTTLKEALRILESKGKKFAVTAGPDGAYIRYNGDTKHVNAFPCKPKDLTGAGDIFAGAVLYGLVNGFTPVASAKAGCYLASKVISHVGARLHSGVKEFWDASL